MTNSWRLMIAYALAIISHAILYDGNEHLAIIVLLASAIMLGWECVFLITWKEK